MPYPYFEEHEDSPRESGNRSGQYNLQRIFLTAWNDRWDFIAEHYRSGPGGLPSSYSPLYPGILADSFEITRLSNLPAQSTISDPNTESISHAGTLAMITITYTLLPSDERESQDPTEPNPLPSGTWCTYRQRTNIEFRSVLGRSCKWLNDGKLLPPDINQTIPDILTTHEVTWHQVQVVPWITLGNMKGCVNVATCRLPGSPQKFRRGTLLFEGMDDEVTLSTDGQWSTRKLTLQFTEKAQKAFTSSGRTGAAPAGNAVYGWNYQYRDDTGVYDNVVSADTGELMFQEYDFNLLWNALE
jgi:hypothetical protein